MRERLIELLKSKPYGYSSYEDFADYLLAEGVVVPPVKIGDTVYCIIPTTHGAKTLREMIVKNISIDIDGDGVYELSYVDTSSGTGLHRRVFFDEIGKTVFLTREEAEQALAERSKR